MLSADLKKLGIVLHGLRHSTPTFALLNDVNPLRVLKMMRHQHYAMMEIYVEEVEQQFERAEDAMTQVQFSRLPIAGTALESAILKLIDTHEWQFPLFVSSQPPFFSL